MSFVYLGDTILDTRYNLITILSLVQGRYFTKGNGLEIGGWGPRMKLDKGCTCNKGCRAPGRKGWQRGRGREREC